MGSEAISAPFGFIQFRAQVSEGLVVEFRWAKLGVVRNPILRLPESTNTTVDDAASTISIPMMLVGNKGDAVLP